MSTRIMASIDCTPKTCEVMLFLTKQQAALLQEAIGFADSESCWFGSGTPEDEVDRIYLYDTLVKQRWLTNKE